MYYTATYSPEDNKLRLYASGRLDAETYARVKAAGFKWAPKQELFVAPAWSPGREDLLIELAGDIEDEDKSLVQRAEEKAERLEALSDRKASEAHRVRDAADQLSGRFDMGQPILVGHHSEKRARKDAERIENGMRKAINLWKSSQYWSDRAEGALANAKYKELPAVRHRRIKGLESDLRKQLKTKADVEKSRDLWANGGQPISLEKAKAIANYEQVFHGLRMPDGEHHWSAWSVLEDGKVTPEYVQQQRAKDAAAYLNPEGYPARWIAHYENRIAYERAMLAEGGGLAADKFDLKPGGQVLIGGEWSTIIRVNKKGGQALSVTTNARFGRVSGVEEIRDYRPATEEAAANVKAATKLAPIVNYPGEGFKVITQEQWNRIGKDYKGTRHVEATEKYGAHRVRSAMVGGYRSSVVFISDAKVKEPPAASGPAPEPIVLPRETDLATAERQAERAKAFREKMNERSEFDVLEDRLKDGVKVVSAPQLFPTPPELAERVIQLAAVEPGVSVLEPSAGTGALIGAMRQIPTIGKLVAVEINGSLADGLRARFPNADVRNGDFLEMNGELGKFDRIVMNPPFANGADIRHVQHAAGKLNPGGRLVAIVAGGPRQREKLIPMAEASGGYWEDLPAGSFESSGTGVNAAIVVIEN